MGLLALPQLPTWRTTPYRLSATNNSVYSQLPSVTGANQQGLQQNRISKPIVTLLTLTPMINLLTVFSLRW